MDERMSDGAPLLVSDYQMANRWNFNFATPKTKFGFKCISMPNNASRDELLLCAEEEFRRWEERVGAQ